MYLGVDLAWEKCTHWVGYWEHSTGTRAWLFGSVGEPSDLSVLSRGRNVSWNLHHDDIRLKVLPFCWLIGESTGLHRHGFLSCGGACETEAWLMSFFGRKVFDHPKSHSGLRTGSAVCYGCSLGGRKRSLVFSVYFMAAGLEVWEYLCGCAVFLDWSDRVSAARESYSIARGCKGVVGVCVRVRSFIIKPRVCALESCWGSQLWLWSFGHRGLVLRPFLV
jgi:hypothetical protein